MIFSAFQRFPIFSHAINRTKTMSDKLNAQKLNDRIELSDCSLALTNEVENLSGWFQISIIEK